MEKNKTTISVEIEQDQHEWLKEIATKFHLPGESKALRILLDFAKTEGDEQQIFGDENARCLRCG